MKNESDSEVLAIHGSKGLFSERWIAYCEEKGIPYKTVNCYDSDIVLQLRGCSALLWHHHQSNPKDILFARQLLFALEHAGIPVFPDFRSAWHFDDKVGQKYLLEALGIEQFVPTWIFYSRAEALEWANNAAFPKVFKLRGGAGSQNVRLVKTRAAATKLINRAFGRGFPSYDALGSFKERFRKYRLGKTDARNVLRGAARLVVPPPYSRIRGNERGYVYFQEFIPNNDSDTRIIVIGDKAFALKRFVRDNDFRASGSGNFKYAKEEFDENCVTAAFEFNRKLRAQCVAYDFLFDASRRPLLVEISYGFDPKAYEDCTGYWDEDMKWHEGRINPYGWMVELIRDFAGRR